MHDASWRIRRLTVMAMLVALSYGAVFFIRIPVVLFLQYEPKDVLLTIGSFLFGPLAGAGMAVTVALLELVTISNTGIIGFAMNVLSSCLFVCTAGVIYHRKKTLPRAMIGLVLGALLMTCGMLLWNYLITPLYMHIPRNEIAGMLVPIFLPYNLLKGGLNAALTVLLYKGVSGALRAAHLLPQPATATKSSQRLSVFLISLIVLALLVLLLLVWRDII